MAIFSNLEGTMKKSFVVGKNGGTLVYENGSLKVMNYQQTDLIPISVANPTDDTHAVNLAYFNSHGGGGGGSAGILHGTDDPLQSLGEDNNVYFKLDSTNILNIFFKDLGVWKPLSVTPVQDSSYVTEHVITPSDWVSNSGVYQYSLPASVHDRGSNIIVQLQDNTGATSMAQVVVSSQGDISITSNTLPTTNYKLLLIGATNLTTPYPKLIDKASWSSVSGAYQLTIMASEHAQASGPLFITVYQNTVDAATSTAPFEVVSVDTSIDSSGNITLTSNILFSGKVVISGK